MLSDICPCCGTPYDEGLHIHGIGRRTATLTMCADIRCEWCCFCIGRPPEVIPTRAGRRILAASKDVVGAAPSIKVWSAVVGGLAKPWDEVTILMDLAVTYRNCHPDDLSVEAVVERWGVPYADAAGLLRCWTWLDILEAS